MPFGCSNFVIGLQTDVLNKLHIIIIILKEGG